MKKQATPQKIGRTIFAAEALMIAANVLGMSYIDYCYTNLGHVDVMQMSTAMTVVSVLSFVFALFTGMIVQRTKSKMGKFRTWVLAGGLLLILGGLLTVTTFSGNTTVNLVVISVGYLMFNVALDFVCTAKYNLFERMAQGQSELVDQYNGNSYAGGNLGYTIYSMVLLSLVFLIGGENENVGFFGTQAIFAVLALVGFLMLLKVSKPFDHEGTDLGEEMPQVGLKEMLKSISGNGPAIAVFVGEIIKCTGYALFNFLLVYMCSNVFGDINFMTIALVVISIVGVLGGMLAPKVIGLLGGRKRASIIVLIVSGVLYLLLGFFGQSTAAFLVLSALAILVQTIADTVEAVLYLDAGEYWYHKTGNDTRAFTMGLQNIGTKVAYAIASPILGVVLVMSNFEETALLVGQDASTLTLATGLLPAAGVLLLALILGVFHKVSDKDMERYIKENAEKDAALYGGE